MNEYVIKQDCQILDNYNLHEIPKCLMQPQKVFFFASFYFENNMGQDITVNYKHDKPIIIKLDIMDTNDMWFKHNLPHSSCQIEYNAQAIWRHGHLKWGWWELAIYQQQTAICKETHKKIVLHLAAEPLLKVSKYQRKNQN